MSLRKGFAAALRDARKHKDLTQEDFSNVSSRTYLSSLERGIKSPTIDKVDKIASVIGIHPVTLLVLAYSRSEGTDIQQLFSRVISETKSLI
jgi:transcriptional regulator with XRE-family HTH domain